MFIDPWWVLLALVAEALSGYPRSLHARVPHPVVWVGSAINAFECRWNRAEWSDEARRLLGVLTVILVAGGAAAAGYVLQVICSAAGSYGMICIALIGTVGLAQRSLYTHVRDVLRPLVAGDVAAARVAVSYIVGRDTRNLSTSEVSAAAIESLAESYNDGVVAPAFWFLLGGLPGLFAYKALNTADSLIGHREPRWRMFGWAAARADDVANLIPARLAALFVAGGGAGGIAIAWRDASRHDSPNAGWPEAAMAGALKIRLGGPAVYDGVAHKRPTFGDGPPPEPQHLSQALRIYIRACALMWLAIAVLATIRST